MPQRGLSVQHPCSQRPAPTTMPPLHNRVLQAHIISSVPLLEVALSAQHGPQELTVVPGARRSPPGHDPEKTDEHLAQLPAHKNPQTDRAAPPPLPLPTHHCKAHFGTQLPTFLPWAAHIHMHRQGPAVAKGLVAPHPAAEASKQAPSWVPGPAPHGQAAGNRSGCIIRSCFSDSITTYTWPPAAAAGHG